MTADPGTTGPPERSDPAGQLGADEVRARATGAAAVLGARNAVIYVFAIASNLALARLLAPRDFGVVTLGTVVVMAGIYLGEAGLGGALIRREQAPTRRELEAISALQVAAATATALVTAAIAVPIGRDGAVVAVMAAALPIFTLRAPYVITLERRLRYRAIATADVVEALTYYAWALGTVALGLGVWGLATAVVVRALCGTATIIRLGGELGFVRPRWSWGQVRPVIGFGARYQANQLLYVVRDQGLNVVVALTAGLATLGVWNLAWRVLQVPNVLFMTVGRISFPAVSRLIGSGHQMRPVIERAVAALAALTAIVAVALVGLGHALPTVAGGDWGEVPTVLLWAGVALIVSVPVVFATTGYLLAVDDVGEVAKGTAAGGATWFAVSVVLLDSLGAPAVGIGWAAGGLVNAALLWRRAAALTDARIAAHLLGPTAVGLAGVAAAWLPARELDTGFLRAAAGFGAGELVVLAGLALVSRPALGDLRSLGAQAVASVRPGAAR